MLQKAFFIACRSICFILNAEWLDRTREIGSYFFKTKKTENSSVMAYYRPQRSCGQGYVFTRVCDSVHRGGVCLSAYWDITPWEQTTPGADTPLPKRQTPAYGQ